MKNLIALCFILFLAFILQDSFAQSSFQPSRIDVRLSHKPVRDTSLVKKKKLKKKQENSVTQDTLVNKIPTTEEIISGLMQSGAINMKGNNFESAMFYYNQVINKYPSSAQYNEALFYRAKCEMNLNSQPAALDDISLFIKNDNCKSSLCAESFFMRGNIYFNSAKYSDAVTDFTEAAKDSTFKNYKFCFFYRGICEGELDQTIQSVQDFTKFINLDNYKTVNSAEALYYRGFYKVRLEDNRGAIKDFDKAIELYQLAIDNSKTNADVYRKKLIDTYISRGLAKADVKKFDDAIADYNMVIKMSPNYATAFRLRGLSEIGKGDLDNGCLDLSKAGELGSPEAYDDIKLRCK